MPGSIVPAWKSEGAIARGLVRRLIPDMALGIPGRPGRGGKDSGLVGELRPDANVSMVVVDKFSTLSEALRSAAKKLYD